MIHRNKLFLLIFFLFSGLSSKAQSLAGPRPQLNTSKIKLALKRLQVTGTALQFCAHPDDENSRLIAYLANERLVRSAYLAATRGDGGQNLLGNETRELLGVIRSQELLAARRIDGGEQWFTRAYDFGYSKSVDETERIWGKQNTIGDMVWIIRSLRPDVMISVAPNVRKTRGHAHHVTSTILAAEAFKMAGDPTKFPEQLKYVKPWQPKRIVWCNTWKNYRDKSIDMSPYPKSNTSTYNPLLGKDYNELSSESSRMHRSQGFGRIRTRRGTRIESFEMIDGVQIKNNKSDWFEGVDLTWNRVKGGDKLIPLFKKAYQEFNIENPSLVVPDLLKAYQIMQTLPKSSLTKYKLNELKNVIFQCMGLWYEALSPVYGITGGDSVKLSLNIIKRGKATVTLQNIKAGGLRTAPAKKIRNNILENVKFAFRLPANAKNSQPYWLNERPSKGAFTVNDQRLIGLPENKPAIPVKITFNVGGVAISDVVPVFYKWGIPEKTERYRALEITPPVTSTITNPVYLFTQGKRNVEVIVKAHKANIKGKITLQLPKGWKSSPAFINFDLKEKYQEQKVSFSITAPNKASEGIFKAVTTVAGKNYSYAFRTIDYDHIPIQTIFPVAEAKLVKLKVKKKGNRIGYIMGSGDKVAESLRQIGYEVDLLKDEDITPQNLKKYDAIMTGIRAYDQNKRMPFYQKTLMDYVKAGGNMVVQYNRSRSKLLTPYPMTLSRKRVSVEEAKMTFLKPKHPVLNAPNKITQADFDHWIQERGVYFLTKWDSKYAAIFACNDPGEQPLKGSTLVAKYGKGNYIYTGLSFFRELPAGVGGAYRLLANMLSLGK